MIRINWQLPTPLSAIVFDCDGTLSSIEGIDELAKQKGVGESVAALTARAMGETGINPDIYLKRLQLVSPKRIDVEQLGEQYVRHVVPDAIDVIQIFQRLQKSVYILSAGILAAIRVFATQLKIPENRIFAVDVAFDADDNFADFDWNSPLICHDGKKRIIQKLAQQHDAIGHIGDGLNDLVAKDCVTRFIGYGGIFFRQHIADQCDFYIRSQSLTPLLPLCLTRDESNLLLPTELSLYEQGKLILVKEILAQKI